MPLAVGRRMLPPFPPHVVALYRASYRDSVALMRMKHSHHNAPRYKSPVGLSSHEHQSRRAAIAISPLSSSLRLHTEPMDTHSLCPRTPWSSHRSVLPCVAPHLTGLRAPTAAPPLLRRRRSPVTSPASPSTSIIPRWAQWLGCAICLSAPVPHHRWRARLSFQGPICKGLWAWGHNNEVLKSSRDPYANRFNPLSVL
jgi:hypothetical protein